jgi:hypothetical protein
MNTAVEGSFDAPPFFISGIAMILFSLSAMLDGGELDQIVGSQRGGIGHRHGRALFQVGSDFDKGIGAKFGGYPNAAAVRRNTNEIGNPEIVHHILAFLLSMHHSQLAMRYPYIKA